MSTGVGDALQAAQDDPEVRAVVITGAGESFCAGADLKAISRRENLFHPDHREWGFAGYVQHYIDKPTIAAVNGTALGGGTELALASDLVVAEERSKFGLPEVKRGLIAAAGGVFRIVDHLPRKVAMELLFTGEPMSSADALKWGLINQVVPDGTVGRRRAGARANGSRQCAAGGLGQQARGQRRRRRRHHRRRTGWSQDHARDRRGVRSRTPRKGRWRSQRSANPSGKPSRRIEVKRVVFEPKSTSVAGDRPPVPRDASCVPNAEKWEADRLVDRRRTSPQASTG